MSTETGYDIDYGPGGPTYHRTAHPTAPPRRTVDVDLGEAPDMHDYEWDDLDGEPADGRWTRRLLTAGVLTVFAGIAGVVTFTLAGPAALIIGGASLGATGLVAVAGRHALTNGAPGRHGSARNRGFRPPRPGRGGMPRLGGRGGRSGMPRLGGTASGGGRPRGKGAAGLGLPSLGGKGRPRGNRAAAAGLGGSTRGKGAGKGKGAGFTMPGLGGTKAGRGRVGGGGGTRGGAGRAGRGGTSTPTTRTPRSGGRTRMPRLPHFPNLLSRGGPHTPGSRRRGTTPAGGSATTTGAPAARRRTWHNPLGIRPVRGGPGRTRRALGRAAWYPAGLPVWLAGRWLLYAPIARNLRADARRLRHLWGVTARRWRAIRAFSPRMQWWRDIRADARVSGAAAAAARRLLRRPRHAVARRWRAFRAFSPRMQWWRDMYAAARLEFGAAQFTNWEVFGGAALAMWAALAGIVRWIVLPPAAADADDLDDFDVFEELDNPAPTPTRKPAPFDPYAGRTRPAVIDDEQDTDTPAPTRPACRPGRTTPPSRPDRTGSARPNRGETVSALMNGAAHPALAKWLEGQRIAIAEFRPGSIPDLNRYLESNGLYSEETAKAYEALAGRLAAMFPGANLIFEYFIAVGAGWRQHGANGVALHQAYRALHADDLARHENPRVNEHLADIARNAWGGQLPPMPSGGVFHERLAIAAAACRDNIGDFFPGDVYYPDSAIIDLLWFLTSMSDAFFQVREYVMDLARVLVKEYPNDVQLHNYFEGYAAGYLDLNHRAKALAEHYSTANAGDVLRHIQPRPFEAWADAANKTMTGA